MLLIIRLSIYLNPPMEEPVKILIKFSLLENYGVRIQDIMYPYHRGNFRENLYVPPP